MNIMIFIINIVSTLFLLILIININIGLCSQIINMMTHEEVYNVFHTERDKVPLHDFIKLNLSPEIYPRRKLSTRNRALSFTAFGRQYNVQLKQRDGVLIGRNTPIWHAKSSILNSSLTDYALLSHILENMSGIYQDPVDMVSLLEYKTENRSQVLYDGIITSDLAISPLSPRLFNVISNGSSGDVKNYVVYKISTENSTTDYSPILDDSQYNEKQIKLKSLPTLYPEILVVVDSSFYEYFNKNPKTALKYLVPFWNAVDLRYTLLRLPKVKLNIAGVVLAQVRKYYNIEVELQSNLTKDEMSLPFIYNNLDHAGRINAKKALIDAGKYFSTNTKFITSKDIVLIMTKRDICSFKSASYCKSSALGKAFTGKACSKNKNIGIFEDNGGYAGIITATHEIGHLLGLPHDGEEEAANCSVNDGFIMASAKFRSINSLCWSSCSKRLLEQFSSLTAAKCLGNKPKIYDDILTHSLPGKILTLEEQCLARGGFPCVFNATICWKLHCTKSLTNMKCVGKAPAAEGSTCGNGLYCRNGECISEIV